MKLSPRAFIFPVLTIGLVLLVLILLDFAIGILGINENYRNNHPDKMHRNDPYLLFVERSNLDLKIPIYSNLISPGTKQLPIKIWNE